MEAAGCSGKYAHMKGTFDPCKRKNILYDQEFLGWQERIVKKLCVVYDPHNILIELLADKEVSLHYIEELEDLGAIKEAINEASDGDTLVLNFGSNTHIISDVITEIKKMCSTSVAVFLCLSQWVPLPSRVTMVNLDIRGKELRRMALNLFSHKEGYSTVTEKVSNDVEYTKKLKVIESQLMNILTSTESLTRRFNDIIELSSKMDELRQAIQDAKEEVGEEKEDSPRANIKQEVILPVSIIAACCDMSSIGERPFMSLEQFVNFTWTRLQDKELTTEEAHKIIFQRYCLAFSDRDQ